MCLFFCGIDQLTAPHVSMLLMCRFGGVTMGSVSAGGVVVGAFGSVVGMGTGGSATDFLPQAHSVSIKAATKIAMISLFMILVLLVG